MFNREENILEVLKHSPDAAAAIKGEDKCPDIDGKVLFYRTKCGVLVVTEVFGLPSDIWQCTNPVFAYHIHDEAGHYNLEDCPHPHHAGDMPPLFGNGGYAFSIFLTDRFFIKDIIGKKVVIHEREDDFKTQPSGDAGAMIATGIITCCS